MNTYKKAQEFAKKYVSPIATKIDEEMSFPTDVFKELGNHGYLSLLIPTEYGGQGKTIEDHVQVCMALSEQSSTVGLCYMMHNVALNTLNIFADDELKDEIYKDIIENKNFITLAYSEFGTGTHFYKPESTMKIKDGKVIINGTKSMVTSATYASYYLVLTNSLNKDAINNWIIKKDTKELNFLMDFWDGIGMRGNVSCPMEMKDIEVDESYRIGKDGSGLEQVLTAVAPPFIAGLAAVYTGLCLNVNEFAVAYAKERKYPDGQKLSEIETIQVHLSDIYSKASAAKTFTLDAAKSAVNGDSDALAKILGARIFASESAIETATIGMKIGGGKAYNKKLIVERLLRDAFASQIMAPSVDVLKVWLGKALTDQQIP